MVIARGEEPTEAAVERQLEENVADANTWALIDPTRDENKFAVINQQFSNQWALQKDAQAFQREMAEQAARQEIAGMGRRSEKVAYSVSVQLLSVRRGNG